MFYDEEKLTELEKKLSENLMSADNHTWKDSHKPHWVNYRHDIPNCLMVIREYRDLLRTLRVKSEWLDKVKKLWYNIIVKWIDSRYIMISFVIGMMFAMLAAGCDGIDSSLSQLFLYATLSIAFMTRGIYVMNRNDTL